VGEGGASAVKGGCLLLPASSVGDIRHLWWKNGWMSSKKGSGGLLLHSENKPNGGLGQGLYEGETALSNQ
jgi:hypothetical protein